MSVKFRFLLIYKNMLKSIATARSECAAKHENKACYSTYLIKNSFIKIKKQLMLTNFTPVTYKIAEIN